MEQLWSPWRIQYILGEKTSNCVFCDAFAADPARDGEFLIVYRGQHCGVIMNLFPYNNGHLMVIPYAHQSSFHDLPEQALLEVMTLMNRSVFVLQQALGAEGFNVGINMGKVAGAGIADHVHMHVLPRWTGDTNYITTLGQTRCIPESLQSSYKKIRTTWYQSTEDLTS